MIKTTLPIINTRKKVNIEESVSYEDKKYSGPIDKTLDADNSTNNLFKFFENFYSSNDEVWDNISDKEKKSFGFMLFRFLSIEYPTTIFNIGGLSQSVGVINALHNIFKVMDYPRWMYLDGKVKANNFDAVRKKLEKYPKHLINKLMEIHQMDGKDFELYVQTFEHELFNHLDSEFNAMNYSKKQR